MLRVGRALAALIIIVILASGCIDKLSTEERFFCIDLTSKSYAYIPKCETQNECFSKAEDAFFNFNTENIPSSTSQELYYFKNHLAGSWLYYNKALKNISKINEICSSNSNHEQILTQLNELNFNLTKAFEESDNAHKKSFSIILLEKITLENESIDKIKEEPLYDYYILLNTNTNELSTLETEKSNSYASFYFQQIEKFGILTQKTGFHKIITASYTPIDFIETYNKSVLNQIPDTVFYIPLVKNAISSSFSFLSDATKTRTAVSLLSTYPSFEFIQSYNDFMGTENSSVKKFSELISKGHTYRQNLIESNIKIHSEIEQNLTTIDTKIKSLSDMQEFDKDFFSEIYALLGQNSEISTQKYSISDFSNAQSLAYDEYLTIHSQYLELQNKKNLNSITLGNETLELKSILASSNFLINNLNYLNSEILDGLHILCSERISLIKSELSQVKIPENLILKITDLKTRLNYKINLFEKQEENEKLKTCKSIAEDYESFRLALLNFEEYETNTELKLSECKNYLDPIFESYKLLISEDFDLDELYIQYKKLKAIPEPYSNIDSITASCESIKTSLNSSLNSNQKIKSLIENYSIANQNTSKINSLYSHYPEFSNSSTQKQLQTQFSSIKTHFPENSPDFSKILPALTQLNENLISLISDSESALKNFTISYIQKNFQLDSFSNSVPNANEPFSAVAKITLRNPFDEISSPIQIQLPINIEFSELLSKSPNILNIKSENNKLTLDLEKIPKGTMFFEIASNLLIKTSEKTELLEVSEKTALFQKIITLETPLNHPKIKITSDLMPDIFELSDIRVVSSEKELYFEMEKNSITFFLETPSKKADIYFSVADPIQKEINLISKYKKNELLSIYEYEIKVKNKLNFEISKITLNFPVNTDSKALKSADLSTPEGKHIDFKTLPNGNIEATIQAIKPGQLGVLRLTVIVEDASQYWNDLLEKIKNELRTLKNSKNQEISSETNSLLYELSNFEEDFYQDQNKIKRITQISEKVSLLNFQNQKLDLLDTPLPKTEEEISPDLKLKSEIIKSNINLLSLSSISELKNKIDTLTYFFEGVNEEELISAQYIPPINQKRLEKLTLKLDSLISADLRNKFDAFLNLHNQQKYSEAISASESFSELLDAKLLEMNSVSSEIDNAYNSIKEQAVVSFNSAVKLFEESEFNPEAQQKLELAESSLKNNQFLKSIVLSKSATGLISASKFKIPQIPIAVYPVILAAVVILTLRFRKKKQSENQKIRTQKVLRNW